MLAHTQRNGMHSYIHACTSTPKHIHVHTTPPWCMRTHPWPHAYHSRLHTYPPHVHTQAACTHLSPHSYSSQVSSLQVQVGPQAPGIFLHASGEESGHVIHPWLQMEGERRGEGRAGRGCAKGQRPEVSASGRGAQSSSRQTSLRIPTQLTCRQATPRPTAPMSSRWLARNCSSLVMQPPWKATAGQHTLTWHRVSVGREGLAVVLHPPAEGRPDLRGLAQPFSCPQTSWVTGRLAVMSQNLPVAAVPLPHPPAGFVGTLKAQHCCLLASE